MKRDELRSLLCEAPYDALVLTSEISRRYATGFHSTAGAVYLSAKQAVFYTDFRYVEAARAAVTDFEVREIGGGKSYTAVINELIEQDGVKKVALEDRMLTYAEYMSWASALHAVVVRLEDGVERLRVCKEDDEVHKIVAAQRIADCIAVMRIRARVDDDRVAVLTRGMDSVNNGSLRVGLEHRAFHAQPLALGDHLGIDGRQRVRAVNARLALTSQVEVGAVDQHYLFHFPVSF